MEKFLETHDDLSAWALEALAEGREIVWANGCFDLFHAGHASLLTQAKNAKPEARLLVAINGDASVTRLKGPGRPIIPENERILMVESHWAVDAVTVFHGDTPLPEMKIIQPKWVVKSFEYAKRGILEEKIAIKNGGGPMYLSVLQSDYASTTKLVNYIRAFQ